MKKKSKNLPISSELSKEPVNKDKLIEEGKDKDGKFSPFNQLYKLATNTGRPLQFTPQTLAEGAYNYFNETIKNPLIQNVTLTVGYKQGQTIKQELQRPFTIEGLCNYLGIAKSNFLAYETRGADFQNVIIQIRQIIYQQKFEGAAVGLFNPNIIARDLGLIEKRELEIRQELTAEERDAKINAILSQVKEGK